MTMTPLLIRRTARTTLRTALCLIFALAIALAPAHAQDNLIAYFPLDGDPAPGTTYGIGTETVSGMIGDALMFNGESVIALPLNLGQYHQLTFTAWVKVTDPELLDGKLVSTGTQPGPELYLKNGKVVLHAGRRALRTDASLPVGQWTFVAGAVDFGAAEARVHQGDIVEASSGVIETDLSRLKPSTYEDPGDPQADRQRFVFIGARDFRLNLSPANPADGIAIDDVRIYSAMLSDAELDAIRSDPGPLAIGPYPPPEEGEDGGEVAETGNGSGSGDTGDEGSSDSTGDNAGDGATDDGGTDAEDGSEDDGDLTLIGARLDDQFYISGLSGDPARYTKTLDLADIPIRYINIEQDVSRSGLEHRPCYIQVSGSVEGNIFPTPSGDQSAYHEDCRGPSARGMSVSFEGGYYIQSLRVCQNKRQNNRIKGLQASAVRVVVNEYTNEVVLRDVATSSDSRPNCGELRQTIRCGDDAVASGVRVRYDEVGSGIASFTGLELVCRKVIPRYEY